MLVTDLLVQLTRIFFVVLSILTVVDYLRHRDRTRRDIALVFVALASSTLISVFLQITGLQPQLWTTLLGEIGVVSQPFLLLRLVAYFRTIPRVVWWVALIGWIISCIALVIFRAPLP